MELRAPNLSMDENLATNLMYGAAVCRLCYYRKPDALPEAGDIEGQAAFWKQHYNTPLGKGTVTKYVYKVGAGPQGRLSPIPSITKRCGLSQLPLELFRAGPQLDPLIDQ